jgi:CheY-like chemotaxis protein
MGGPTEVPVSRVLLCHWNADEAEARAAKLRDAGHDVKIHASEADLGGLRAVRESPPDVCVVDLARLPSHGREVGVWWRRQKNTRLIPLVFVEGDREKTKRVRDLLPDAHYTSWGRIRSAIRSAVKRSIGKPIVPDTMAGYSGTPLVKKLGIKPGSRLALLGAPEGFEPTPLPDDVAVLRRAGGKPADVVLLFSRTKADLSRRFDPAARMTAEGGRLWLLWPKQASPLAADLTQAGVRRHGMGAGWVDFKIAAIDADWSGLCFVRRGAAR